MLPPGLLPSLVLWPFVLHAHFSSSVLVVALYSGSIVLLPLAWCRNTRLFRLCMVDCFFLHLMYVQIVSMSIILTRFGSSVLWVQVEYPTLGLPSLGQCECGHTSQTVRHILTDCRKFNRLRQEIWKDEQRKEPFGVVEWKKILTHPPYTKKAVDFMRRTRLLKQYKEVS